MKKIKHLVLIITLLLFPIMVNAEGNVSITKIELKEVKGDALEISKPTFKGLDVNYNLSFHKVGDSITYIATIKNNDKEDYKITNKSSFSDSGYMEYTFNFTDNSNIIKTNETKDMYITINYKNEVPMEKLVNGAYTEQNKMNLILVNNRGQEVNPNTQSTIYFIIGIILLLSISLVIFKKHKKLSVFLIALSLLLPVTTYALKEITITLNTRVEVVKNLEFCYENDWGFVKRTIEEYNPYSNYPYEAGMTFNDWSHSEFGMTLPEGNFGFKTKEFYECRNEVYNKYSSKADAMKAPDTKDGDTNGDLTILDPDEPPYEPSEYEIAMNECWNKYTEPVNKNSKIRRSNEGCYYRVIEVVDTVTGR